MLQYAATFIHVVQPRELQRPHSVPPPTATKESSEGRYVRALIPRTAESFQWRMEDTQSAGSEGHPHLCGCPCIRFAYRSCHLGKACKFCHLPHGAKSKLARTQRKTLEALSEAELLTLLLPIIEERCASFPQMTLVLASIQRRLRRLPLVEPPKGIRVTLATLEKLSLGRLLELLERSNLSSEFREELQCILGRVLGRYAYP
ncbi:unnamed protein product [Effrenium voratum]|nr:unnamed protein product [Effrenium voratum]